MTRVQRATAIRICAIAASTPGFLVDCGWGHIEGATGTTFRLAWSAYLRTRIQRPALRWAEAEAMLREGWVP